MKLSKHSASSSPSSLHFSPIPQPDQHSALLLVDLQNDFFPGGALAIPGAELLIPLINTYIQHFSRQDWTILATRDWHPPNHVSFSNQQGNWPLHCVQGSRGAQFHSDVVMPPGMIIISKGTDPRKEAKSCFDGTSLADRLEDFEVQTVFVLGLSIDECITQTVQEACQQGLHVVLLTDATRIHSNQNEASTPFQEMADAGVFLANTSHFQFAPSAS
jgi:nicotinamidase/pyrazinamidase